MAAKRDSKAGSLASSRWNNDPNDTAPPEPTPSEEPATYFQSDTAILDLGRDRFDHDVAAVGDRDTSFYVKAPIHVAKGRAPKGLEAQVFAWNTMHYTTEDKDEKEEMKGDLHGGNLHRLNRAAREPPLMSFGPRVNFTSGGRGGRGGKIGGQSFGGPDDDGTIRAAMKPDHDCWPCAKGFAAEMSADMFWDEPIV